MILKLSSLKGTKTPDPCLGQASRSISPQRKMVRTYEERPVDPSAVERILETAQRAPSAGFSQGFEFIVFEGDEARRFWDVMRPDAPPSHFPDLAKAPVVIVPVARKSVYLDRYAEEDKAWEDRDESRWPVPYWIVDTAFASMLALLAAVDEGLGALFFGIGDAAAIERFKTTFGVPDEAQPIGAIAIGHPTPARSPDAVRHGRWPGVRPRNVGRGVADPMRRLRRESGSPSCREGEHEVSHKPHDDVEWKRKVWRERCSLSVLGRESGGADRGR